MRGRRPEPAPRRKPGEAAAAAAAEAEAWAAADLAGTTYPRARGRRLARWFAGSPECAIEWFHYDCVGLDARRRVARPICAVAEPHLAMQLASGMRVRPRAAAAAAAAAGADAAAAGVGAAGAAAAPAGAAAAVEGRGDVRAGGVAACR